MVRPVASQYSVSLGYRQKANFDPNYIHRGIDYRTPVGTPVVATTAGTVVAAGRYGGYGSAYGIQVVIRTGDVWHLYAHLSSESVSVGQSVATGQQIGRTGESGNVTGPHLHYQENTQPPAAYKSDRAPRFIDAAGQGAAVSTVFDFSLWCQAHYPWFSIPWWKRIAGIGQELRGNEAGTEASMHAFTELYSEETANSVLAELRKNGDPFVRPEPPGRVGMEFMPDSSKWTVTRATNYASGIQNRYLYVVHNTHKRTGQHVAVIVGHAPISSDYDKARWGKWAAGIVADVEGPRVIAWDFNRNPNGESPRKEIEALGFRHMRSQAAIANESADEFPSRGWSLADIYTIPSEARITGGQIDLTSSTLSDHRRLEARIVIPA